MKRFCLLLYSLMGLCAILPAQDFAIDTVYFAFDAHSIREEYRQELDSTLAVITEYPSYYIEVFGHTDSIGTDAYNQMLSEKRAKAIYDFLIEKGIESSRITYKGFGTSKPAATNTTFSGRKRNRRSDIAIIYTDKEGLLKLGLNGDGTGVGAEGDSTQLEGEMVLSGDQDLSDSYNSSEEEEEKSMVDTVYADLAPFAINPRNTTYIFAQQGTKIVIQPNTLNTRKKEIDFQVKELLSRKDLLLTAMPTVSKDGPLQTTGMVMIQATDRGRFVRLKGGKTLEVEIPVQRNEEGLSLYLGKGGERGARRNNRDKDEGIGFNPVQTWALEKNVPLDYDQENSRYKMNLSDMGRFNLARPLYLSEGTTQNDDGFDIFVKLKGKRFERKTRVYLTSGGSNTVIPLSKQSKRWYEGNRMRFLNRDAEISLVAIQYDNEDEPYLATESFKISERLIEPKKKDVSRPYIQMKVKFRRKSMNDLLGDLSNI